MIRARNRWWVVFACVLGVVCTAGPVNVFTFSVFLRPVAESLHLDRSVLAGAWVWTGIATALCAPVAGVLLDRVGARRVILVGIVLFAAATALQSLLSASLAVIYLLFVLRGAAAAGPSPATYAYVVTHWFDRRRGLALGIALAGVGLGTAIIPPFAAHLIAAFGWRAAYIGVGAFMLVVAGVPVFLLVREPDAAERAALPHLAGASLPGMSLREALTGSPRFWVMALAFFLGIIVLNGTLTQIVAMLMDRGVRIEAATSVLAASGIAALAGRLLSGWCADRLHGPYVAIGFFLLLMIGTACFASELGGPVPLIAAILCGLANGAEIDLMGFFVSRYFGLKAYGAIMGVMFGIFTASTGIGPYISTKSFDLYHSYGPAFRLYEGIILVAMILFALLGPYRFPARHRQAAALGREKAPA